MSSQVRLIAWAAALLFVYFTVPVHADGSVVVRAVLTLAGLALATVLIVNQMRHQLHDAGSPLWTLALAVIGGVLAFALTDYIISVARPGEFSGLHTRLDALYFALTTLATVGYGDVNAVGQIARTAVSIQLVFNILVVTAAASLFTAQLQAKRAASGS